MNKELGAMQPTTARFGRRRDAAILGSCFSHCCYNPAVKHIVLSAGGDATAALEFIKEIKLCEKRRRQCMRNRKTKACMLARYLYPTLIGAMVSGGAKVAATAEKCKW
jgi:hypothetical protein